MGTLNKVIRLTCDLFMLIFYQGRETKIRSIVLKRENLITKYLTLIEKCDNHPLNNLITLLINHMVSGFFPVVSPYHENRKSLITC